MTLPKLHRRDFLKSAGALVIGFQLGIARASVTPDRSLSLGPYGPSDDQLDSWLSIDHAGVVTLYTGISEIGTGTHTAILQIMADEMDVSLAKTNLVGPDTSQTPDQFVSSGSRSVERHAIPIRMAAAEARHVLVDMAATHLQVPAEQLTVIDGTVQHVLNSSKCVSYAELIGGKEFQLKMTGKVKPKKAAQYKIVGKSIPRFDLPGKMNGTFRFLQDVRVPGMLHGRVVRPPSHGATVISVDETSVAHLPGVVKVVRQADLVGVVCQREEQAISAARQLKVTWSDWSGLPEMKGLFHGVRDIPVYTDGVPAKAPNGVIENKGDVNAAFSRAAKTVQATYESPYHLHGSIGPSCCVADVRADGVTIWTGTQTLFGLREATAKFLGLPNEAVHAIFVEGSGCYGQNGADDVTVDAVVLSKAVGKPVRVQWMRPDEMGWESYKTVRVSDIRGGLDAEGKIIAWDSQAWGFSGYSRPEYHEPKHGGEPGSLITAQLAGWDKPGLEEGFYGITLSSVPQYEAPNKKITFNYLGPASHRMGPIRIRVGSMRGVGAPDNLFMIESFVDELAAAAVCDPAEFRLKHLSDERSKAAIETVLKKANWEPRPAYSAPKRKGDIATGRGIAIFGSGDESRVASIFDVEVNCNTGVIRVKKVTVAFDCGLIVNPDGVRSQAEGGVIQGISRGLMEQVHFNRSTVTSRDWMTYPIVRFTDVPDEIDITLINRPELPAFGVGEGGTQSVWAGLSNAIYDATGVRMRRLPFTPQQFLETMAEQHPSMQHAAGAMVETPTTSNATTALI